MATVNVSRTELFSAPVITKAIKQIATPYERLQRFFGLQMDSPNIEDRRGREFGYDIENPPRELANARSPASGPGTRAPVAASHVTARCPRLHDKIMLIDDLISGQRVLGAGPDQVDRSGQAYVLRQQRYLGQMFKNAREFMVSRIFRGGFGVTVSGQDWVLTEIGAGGNYFDVDYRVPASNKTQLNMLGAGNLIDTLWSTLSADIPKQLANIRAASQQQDGRPIAHAWCQSYLFHQYVMNNTVIQAQGGTANQAFLSWEKSTYTGPDGTQDTGFDIVLRAIPWLTWHTYDAVLSVNGTLTPAIATGHVAFCPTPYPDWVGGFNGSEMVRENVTQTPVERTGFWAWAEPRTQPAGEEIIAVDNFMPALYVPTCIKDATVL